MSITHNKARNILFRVCFFTVGLLLHLFIDMIQHKKHGSNNLYY